MPLKALFLVLLFVSVGTLHSQSTAKVITFPFVSKALLDLEKQKCGLGNIFMTQIFMKDLCQT